MKPIAIMIAGYSPGFPAEHLGATKKIELVAKLLARLGYELHYLDSGHPDQGATPALCDQPAKVGDTPVHLWRPACLPNRKLGKLANVLHVGSMLRQLAEHKPAIIWLFNSYAFEAKWGMALKKMTGARLVLELEDMPLARGRGMNPKPLLDEWFFRKLLPKVDLATFVNSALQRQFQGRTRQSLLLPSVLQDALVDLPDRQRFNATPFTLGYFGGLETDKGVGLLLDLIPRMPAGWRLVITGVGPLAEPIRAIASQHPHAVDFLGTVSHAEVVRLMSTCDAIVNPHSPISQMGDGVFPFKVCEALATGALLISTPLPTIDLDLEGLVETFDGTLDGLTRSMRRAPGLYRERQQALAELRRLIVQLYGEGAVFERIREALHALGPLR